MCGVPVERANDYLQKLIALGHRVAVCEQLEDPAEAKKRGAKSVVRRDVTRLVTPGTITEETLLDPARPNAFAALARALAARTAAGSMGSPASIFRPAHLRSWSARRPIFPANWRGWSRARSSSRRRFIATLALSEILAARGAPVTPLGRDAGEGASAERRLMEFYGVATLEGFGALTPAELAACACAILYVERTQKAERPALARPLSQRDSKTLDIDAATRANLEISRTLSGAREGSLLSVVDLTVTPAGARLLGERIGAPSTDQPRNRGPARRGGVFRGKPQSARGVAREAGPRARSFPRVVAARLAAWRPARPRGGRRGAGGGAGHRGTCRFRGGAMRGRGRHRRARRRGLRAGTRDYAKPRFGAAARPPRRRLYRARRRRRTRRGPRAARPEPPNCRRISGEICRADRNQAAQDKAQ